MYSYILNLPLRLLSAPAYRQAGLRLCGGNFWLRRDSLFNAHFINQYSNSMDLNVNRIIDPKGEIVWWYQAGTRHEKTTEREIAFSI